MCAYIQAEIVEVFVFEEPVRVLERKRGDAYGTRHWQTFVFQFMFVACAIVFNAITHATNMNCYINW